MEIKFHRKFDKISKYTTKVKFRHKKTQILKSGFLFPLLFPPFLTSLSLLLCSHSSASKVVAARPRSLSDVQAHRRSSSCFSARCICLNFFFYHIELLSYVCLITWLWFALFMFELGCIDACNTCVYFLICMCWCVCVC